MGVRPGEFEAVWEVALSCELCGGVCKFIAMMPVWLGVYPTWTAMPENSRIDVALQMSWRRGPEIALIAAWLSVLGLTTLGGGQRDATYWSAQLAAYSPALNTEICHGRRGPMMESDSDRWRCTKAAPTFTSGFRAVGEIRSISMSRNNLLGPSLKPANENFLRIQEPEELPTKSS